VNGYDRDGVSPEWTGGASNRDTGQVGQASPILDNPSPDGLPLESGPTVRDLFDELDRAESARDYLSEHFGSTIDPILSMLDDEMGRIDGRIADAIISESRSRKVDPPEIILRTLPGGASVLYRFRPNTFGRKLISVDPMPDFAIPI
jgi:hypothetical protein